MYHRRAAVKRFIYGKHGLLLEEGVAGANREPKAKECGQDVESHRWRRQYRKKRFFWTAQVVISFVRTRRLLSIAFGADLALPGTIPMVLSFD